MFCHYRSLTVFLFAIFLSSCATIQANYYTQTINSWRGANVSTLLKTWGKPDKKLTTLSGNTVYVYKKQEYRSPNASKNPAVGVNYHPGGTPVVTTHQTHWNNGMTLFCIVAYEVDADGTIIDTEIQGNNCVADSTFMQHMQNPTNGR